MASPAWSPRKRRFALFTPVALAALFGLLVWTQPAVAALACPSCFALERLAPDLYVDRAMAGDERARLVEAISSANARVAAFYGDLQERPTVLACATGPCARRLGGGGARGVAYATFALRLSPAGLDPVIIAHERSHVELHGRLGLLRWAASAVPAWFDEGLAVAVSDDPRYLRPAEAGADRCRAGAGRPASRDAAGLAARSERPPGPLRASRVPGDALDGGAWRPRSRSRASRAGRRGYGLRQRLRLITASPRAAPHPQGDPIRP